MQLFKLDSAGVCGSCLKKATDADTIRCDTCDFNFHALCESAGGKTELIANKSHLSSHKQKSTKKNFIWKCDRCLTVSEENQAASVRDLLEGLSSKFESLQNKVTKELGELADKFTSLENKVTDEIKTQVGAEFVKLVGTQSEEFKKLGETINTAVPNLPPNSDWKKVEKVKQMKKSLMVKPDKNGVPLDTVQVKKLVRDNGIPVVSVVSAENGDTFINLPNEASRNKLQPLLPSEANTIVSLESKLPSVKLLGVVDKLSNEEIKSALCSQNEALGTMVHAGEELSVVYTKEPTGTQRYHQVTLRVSPDIRASLEKPFDKLYLNGNVCTVADSFHVRRCNKCQSFGHYAGKCKAQADSCGHCGEQHKSSDCPKKDESSANKKCINCERAELEPAGHSTFYYNCPAYVIQQEKLKKAISYEYKSNSSTHVR